MKTKLVVIIIISIVLATNVSSVLLTIFIEREHRDADLTKGYAIMHERANKEKDEVVKKYNMLFKDMVNSDVSGQKAIGFERLASLKKKIDKINNDEPIIGDLKNEFIVQLILLGMLKNDKNQKDQEYNNIMHDGIEYALEFQGLNENDVAAIGALRASFK